MSQSNTLSTMPLKMDVTTEHTQQCMFCEFKKKGNNVAEANGNISKLFK